MARCSLVAYAERVRIDDNDTRAAFRQAADDLRKRITAGEFRPGEKLPSIRELAEEYGVAPQTMQNALRELRNAKVVASQQGRGLFVRDPDSQAAGPEPERLAAVEAGLRELQDRMAAVEQDNAGLRALIKDLRGRIEQPQARHATSIDQS
jgi:DNA-binding transcriptional regulator YhcF (GntR family)